MGVGRRKRNLARTDLNIKRGRVRNMKCERRIQMRLTQWSPTNSMRFFPGKRCLQKISKYSTLYTICNVILHAYMKLEQAKMRKNFQLSIPFPGIKLLTFIWQYILHKLVQITSRKLTYDGDDDADNNNSEPYEPRRNHFSIKIYKCMRFHTKGITLLLSFVVHSLL